MNDLILARSFSRNERKRFGNFAFLICLAIAVSMCTVFKPHFHFSVLKLELLANAGLDIVLVQESSIISLPVTSSSRVARVKNGGDNSTILTLVAQAPKTMPDSSIFTKSHDTASMISDSFDVRGHHAGPKMEESVTIKCNFSEQLSDYCEINGRIRVDGNTSTIYVVGNNHHHSTNSNTSSWTIKPYARKQNEGAMSHVREWTIKIVDESLEGMCTKNATTTPALLFSTGGFSGNHFHDFSDLVVPLFSTARNFNKNVHFLATDYQPWWISKFRVLLAGLSEHDVVNIDKESGTRCYENVIVGLRNHKELGIDASRSPHGHSMTQFRQFLRSTYALKREKTSPELIRKGKPHLMIISRRKTRILMNEDRVVRTARRMGYRVTLADATLSTNLSRFAETVNSCDVLMGVHGAGLTNMVFLPDNAVVIQVVPLGGIDGLAKQDFGEPSKDMNLRYLSYRIRAKESSLVTEYPVNSAVISDPSVVHKQGWDAIRTIYLEKQNVKLDVHRFRHTLLKARDLLHH